MSGKNRLQGGVAKHANRLLPKVDALFKERGISYCLDGGTLLGVIREGRLLPWDDDLDFFVPSESAAAIKNCDCVFCLWAANYVFATQSKT